MVTEGWGECPRPFSRKGYRSPLLGHIFEANMIDQLDGLTASLADRYRIERHEACRHQTTGVGGGRIHAEVVSRRQ